MKRWKYGVVETISKLSVESLNKLGDKGWELVSTIYCEIYGYTYYFKQEINE